VLGRVSRGEGRGSLRSIVLRLRWHSARKRRRVSVVSADDVISDPEITDGECEGGGGQGADLESPFVTR
jgi:hypothetical protein